ncbi:hypothetical protein M3Y98_00654300 [Aphelenchoides besseyi]|nr:hypothetical protein M3Y98_00654300 [Aphelenchoides besseyi]
MKSTVLVLLLGVSAVVAAPIGGNLNVQGGDPANSGLSGNLRGPGGGVSVDTKLRHFKGTLYLFAPQSWIDTFNAIPQQGQECLLNTFSDPTNAAVTNSNDVEQAKQLAANACPDNSAQINAFFDATESTIKSLPETFITQLKAFGEQAKQLGESFKQQAVPGSAPNAGAPNMSGMKQKIAEFSKISATFLQQLSALPQETRQQIANAFPKLTPFIVGPNSDTFLKELTELYTTLSSGQFDANTLRTEGQQLKTALTAVWNDYKIANADGLQQASTLFGRDLSSSFQSGSFLQGGMPSSMNGGDATGQQGNFRTQMQNAWENVKNKGTQEYEKAKEAGQNAWDRFRQGANNHGFQANGSVENNGASVDVEAH